MEDVEYFLPSEIARLVYGHLVSTRNDKLAEQFLRASPYMQECLETRNLNLSFGTTANGLTLEEILNQFVTIQRIVSAATRTSGGKRKFSSLPEAVDSILNDEEQDAVENDFGSDELTLHVETSLSGLEDTTAKVGITESSHTETATVNSHPKVCKEIVELLSSSDSEDESARIAAVRKRPLFRRMRKEGTEQARKTIKTLKPKRHPVQPSSTFSANEVQMRTPAEVPEVSSSGVFSPNKVQTRTPLKVIDVESIKIPPPSPSPIKKILTLNDDENCEGVDVSIFKEKLENNSSFLERITDTINKVINSPQKNISTCSDDLDKAIKEVIHESEQSFLIDDILSELGLGKAKEPKKLIKNDYSFQLQPEEMETECLMLNNTSYKQAETDKVPSSTAKAVADPDEVTEKTIIPENSDTRAEEPTTENCIISSTAENPMYVSQSIGSYLSYPADIMSPLKETPNEEQMIRVYSMENSEIVSSIQFDENNTTVLDVPVTNAIPLYQYYSGLMPLGYHNVRTTGTKFIPIAPRPCSVAQEATDMKKGQKAISRRRTSTRLKK